MLSSVANCLRNYLNFSGRSTRSEFWWFYLFTILVHAVAAVADGAMGEDPSVDFPVAIGKHALRGVGTASLTSYAPVFSLVSSLVLFPAMLSAGSRRMRDVGKPPSLYIIPVFLSVALFTFWWFEIGQYGLTVFFYGDPWQIYLTYAILPIQVVASLFCTWFLVKPSS